MHGSTPPWPKQERAEKIRSLMDEFSWVGGLLESGEQALRFVYERPDPEMRPPERLAGSPFVARRRGACRAKVRRTAHRIPIGIQ